MKYCNKNVYICDRWEFYLYYSIYTHFYSLLHGMILLHYILSKKVPFYQNKMVIYFFLVLLQSFKEELITSVTV